MAGSLDHSVKPCDNFYDFACGGWIKANIPNQKKPLITKLNKLQDTVYDILNGRNTVYDILNGRNTVYDILNGSDTVYDILNGRVHRVCHLKW